MFLATPHVSPTPYCASLSCQLVQAHGECLLSPLTTYHRNPVLSQLQLSTRASPRRMFLVTPHVSPNLVLCQLQLSTRASPRRMFLDPSRITEPRIVPATAVNLCKPMENVCCHPSRRITETPYCASYSCQLVQAHGECFLTPHVSPNPVLCQLELSTCASPRRMFPVID